MRWRPLIAVSVIALSADLVSATIFTRREFLVNDRARNAVQHFNDLNGNGAIGGAAEINIFYDTTNAPGTRPLSNPTCLDVRRDGLVVLGDQGNTCVYFMRDLNHDGDMQDAGEITVYVGAPAFGAGNGPYSPQEIVVDALGVGYLHNSSSGLNGVHRFVDNDNNGRADDPGEFTVFFNGSNASGFALSAGFALEPDAIRPGALYLLQTATGGVDQLIRIRDNNADNDAQDAGEAELLWSTAESGFTNIDVISLEDGRVLVTDNSGKRVIVLTDLDADDRFTTAGERADFFLNTLSQVGDVRQISPLRNRLIGDVNCDGVVNNFDIDAFVLALTDPTEYMNQYPNCDRALGDVSGDGVVDNFDIDPFVILLTGG